MKNIKKLFQNNLFSSIILLLIIALFSFNSITAASEKGVKVKKGWTPIPNGEAKSEKDITMKNENLAITIAGPDGTTPPWGVPAGGILDAAPVVDGKIKLDSLTIVDFLPDRWSAWPTTYQKAEIVKNTPEVGIVEVKRDWYQADLITRFTLKKEAKHIHMETTLKNSEKTHKDIRTGYTLATKGGWIDVPGGRGLRKDTLGDWMVGYNENWAFGLHSNFHNEVKGGKTWTEQFKTHTLKPGEEKTYESWFQIENSGDAAPIINFNLSLNNRPKGTVKGKVKNIKGNTIKKPIIAAYKNGELIGWTVGKSGKYKLNLPTGKYKLQAMAENNTPSSKKEVSINQNSTQTVNLNDVKTPGKINITIEETDTQKPLDARIELSGGPEYPINYLGTNTKFTNLTKVGKASFKAAPATYNLNINSGADFVSKEKTLKNITVKSEKTKEINTKIDINFTPNNHNWYSADLHQHSNVLDGITPPKDLVVSNLAAQLDLTFLSDHDNVKNHKTVNKYSQKRNIPFIPSIEISPMWAHFNVFPIPKGYNKLTTRGTAKEIFNSARKLDNSVIQINHPWTSYGYYYSQKHNKIPGEYSNDYDVVEMNEGQNKTMEKMYEHWNNGEKKFLVSTTDIHDVRTDVTGKPRTYAKVNGVLNAQSYSKAVKEGNSFITYGPLVYPEKEFGKTYEAKNNVFQLSFTAKSVNGLKEIHVVNEGEIIKSKILSSEFVDLENIKSKSFDLFFKVTEKTWYSLIIIDKKGNYLYSNPIWVK